MDIVWTFEDAVRSGQPAPGDCLLPVGGLVRARILQMAHLSATHPPPSCDMLYYCTMMKLAKVDEVWTFGDEVWTFGDEVWTFADALSRCAASFWHASCGRRCS